MPRSVALVSAMRLNRYLAAAGLGSRRGVEELISSGRVRINGRVIEDLATIVGPEDVVKVGSRVVKKQLQINAVLYKPPGYLVTADDERDRKTIFDLLPGNWPRVFHVGRLDKESEGLLIVTNDGDLSLALTHPRYKISKEYEVLLDKPLEALHREKLLKGFHIQGGKARMESVERIHGDFLRIILKQGIKRQIRLMLYELGYEVKKLKRVRIGPLMLGNLHPGEWRLLSGAEVATLRKGEKDKPAPSSTATSQFKPIVPLSDSDDRTEKPERRRPRPVKSSGSPTGAPRRTAAGRSSAPGAPRRSGGAKSDSRERPEPGRGRGPRGAGTAPADRAGRARRTDRGDRPAERHAPRTGRRRD